MKRRFVRFFLIVAPAVMAPQARGQVVTSRFVSSDTLDNPAAATFRKNKGVFIRANRDEDRTVALDLADSSLEIETTTNVLQAAFLYQSSALFLETNMAFQQGRKVTASSVSSSEFETSSGSNTNSIDLIPIQGIAALRLGTSARIGLKLIRTTASGSLENDFRFSKKELLDFNQEAETLTTVKETNRQSSRYETLGFGSVVGLFGSGFYLGLGADLMQLSIDQSIQGRATVQRESASTERVTSVVNRRKINVVKQMYGLAYLYHSAKMSFRSEISYQRLPPLDASSSYRDGELSRATTEAIWKNLYAGVEVASQRGFFVDPNNLIPIYFNFAHLIDKAVFSYGVFGGFKLSEGNSFGISYFQSEVQRKEQLSASDPVLYRINRNTRSFGASYSYVF